MTLRVGARLPALELPTPEGAAAPVWVRGREPVAVAWLHDASCSACAAIRAAWATAPPRLAPWGGALVLVVPALVPAPTGARLRLDPEGRWAAAAGCPAPALAVADPWGEVVAVWTGHDGWPDASGLEEWVRYVAVQCPECTIVEGPWRAL